MTVSEQMDAIIEQIQDADAAYYLHDNPVLSDAEYDALRRQLLTLEATNPEVIRPNSPSQRVGVELSGNRPTCKHGVSMLSLDNAMNEDELRAFLDKTLRDTGDKYTFFVGEPKIDGLSINLVYENGLLTQAITRGDGEVGEVVLENADPTFGL